LEEERGGGGKGGREEEAEDELLLLALYSGVQALHVLLCFMVLICERWGRGGWGGRGGNSENSLNTRACVASFLGANLQRERERERERERLIDRKRESLLVPDSITTANVE
jgi:hypothetical protein